MIEFGVLHHLIEFLLSQSILPCQCLHFPKFKSWPMADIRRSCIWNATIGIDSESTFCVLLRLFKFVPAPFTDVWVCVITSARRRVVNEEAGLSDEVVVIFGEGLHYSSDIYSSPIISSGAIPKSLNCGPRDSMPSIR